MNPALVYSKKDLAGKNIARHITQKTDLPLMEIEQDIIYAEIDELKKDHGFDYAVMLSRHKSKSGKPCFTVHAPGNFDEAKYGGEERTLAKTIAEPMHRIYLELRKTNQDYAVCREATHHGPTPETPLFFVELGSSKTEWKDEKAADFIAGSVVRGLESSEKFPVALGFGGGHYCPKFSEMTGTAFSHVCPKYMLDALNKDLIEQMVSKTFEEVELFSFDGSNLSLRHKKLLDVWRPRKGSK